MKRHLFIRLSQFVIVFILASCTSYRYIDIQVLKPAEGDTILKANRIFIINAKKLVIDSVNQTNSKYYIKFLKTFGTELAKNLKKSPLYENADILNISLESMMDEYEDMSFEERKRTLVCAVQSVLFTDTAVLDEYYSSSVYKILISYKLLLNLNKLALTDSNIPVILTDTIFDSYAVNFDPVRLNKKLQIMYEDIIKYAAEKAADNLAPFWITVERNLFYYSNKSMTKAYSYYENNQLDKAISQWKFIYNKATRNIASKAAHNIAVCYEVQDSLSLAKQWIDKSVLLQYNKASIEYQQILNNRIKEQNLLNSQLLTSEH